MNDIKIEPGARQLMSGPPAGYFLVIPQGQEQEVASLATVMTTVMQRWRLITAAVFGCAVVALVISLFMPKIYRAKIVVAPVMESEQVGASGLGTEINNELGGIASLAGIDLGGDARKQQFLATLKSLGFARDFVASENLAPLLFPNLWDAKSGTWKPGVKIPTLSAAARKFADHHRAITEDRKTGMVTVLIDWTSPELAARLANRTIEMVNDRLRGEAVRNADLSIEYLEKELAKTSMVGVQQGINALIEQQIDKSMIANVQKEYAYKIIDPAITPDVKYSPQRALIACIGAIAGLVFSLAYVLLRRRPQGAAGR
jgi:LPS O-antigen subunit length determinant protein (WzzB/FepE family)